MHCRLIGTTPAAERGPLFFARCPFCGGYPKVFSHRRMPWFGRLYFYAQCTGCGTVAPGGRFSYTTDGAAVRAWETRFDPNEDLSKRLVSVDFPK